MIRVATLGLLFFLQAPSTALAFESDVHFGLTKWLALKAGYNAQQANTIALGNQRSDSGIMDSIELVLEYACLGKHRDGSDVAAKYHFPSRPLRQTGPVSADGPDGRTIVAGGENARQAVERVMAAASEGKSEILLLKLGEGLHRLQDSWAYQGAPQTPQFDEPSIQCSGELAWGAPAQRGGWDSHRADMTSAWPADVRAMAGATYEVLTRFAPVANQPRNAAAPSAVMQELEGFIAAGTKSGKRAWFRARGIEETTFLNMVSLPDAGTGFDASWQGRQLARLPSTQTKQYGVAAEAKQFFDGFFSAWLFSGAPESALGTKPGNDAERELAARLQLWRMRDHGSVAELAHSRGPLTKKQLSTVARLAAAPAAYARYETPEDAYFPLLEQGPVISPLLPYVIHVLPGTDGRRMIAVAKLRHLPYDEIGVIAQKQGASWRAVRIVSAVNH
jgi:hypothetical protein